MTLNLMQVCQAWPWVLGDLHECHKIGWHPVLSRQLRLTECFGKHKSMNQVWLIGLPYLYCSPRSDTSRQPCMSLYCPALARARARVMVPRPALIPYARTKPLLKPSHAGLQILSAVIYTGEYAARKRPYRWYSCTAPADPFSASSADRFA